MQSLSELVDVLSGNMFSINISRVISGQ
jgi:hypothetical protein